MDFVWHLAFYLHLSTKDLVVAFVILERCFSAGQAIVLRPHTARKLFLASCTIARKFSTDERLFNRDAAKSLAQAFTALDMEHLQALERQATPHSPRLSFTLLTHLPEPNISISIDLRPFAGAQADEI